MKEAVTKVIDMLTQEDFLEAFQMLLHLILIIVGYLMANFVYIFNINIYIISKHILLIMFLNELKLILSHTVK